MTERPAPIRNAWIIWAVACFAYLVAVLQRSSLGVAGTDAAARLGIGAAELSSLAVAQLIVYAAMQIPVGVLLDRFGPRALITAGALVMALGQGLLAIAPDLSVAIGGRMLVGLGDAATFIAVMRLLPAWFPGRIVPQLSQWTGNLGQIGQLLSAVPLAWALDRFGWTYSFSAVALLGVGVFALCALVLADTPNAVVSSATDSIEIPASWWSKLRTALRRPGTQLGFWAHFATQSPGTVITLLWGYPLLSGALGYERTAAAGMLSIVVISGMIVGPLLGLATARFPMRRSSLVIAIVLHMAAALAVMLSFAEPPLWSVVWMLMAIGIGGPGSLIGFDFARTFNPLRILGSANGIVNVGGFLASFTMMGVIGLVLDAHHAHTGSELYDWSGFRLALCVMFVVLGFGLGMMLLARAHTRRRLEEEEGITVGPLWKALYARLRRR